MVRHRRPTLPKAVLREIMVGNAISPGLARRQAEKADYDAEWAYLDDRPGRCKELRRRADALRKLAAEAETTNPAIP